MKIEKNAVAGTLESSDIYISVEPAETLELEIDSVVSNQYYDEIHRTLQEVLQEYKIESGKVSVKDRGALECVIRARMETAIKRGGAC
ncbi:MAG: citrate lyase acyl carrier protein [Lachnospiraceae bacterium]|jgi:citrate lyase subunit gamma (acyl carrier protein)